MKNTLMAFSTISLAAIGFAQPASALGIPAGAYAVVRGGDTVDNHVQSVNLADDTAFGVGLGAYVGPLRVEGALDRISADTGVVNFHALDYHADAYLDVPIGHLTVFGGAGLDYIQAQSTLGPSSVQGTGRGWNYAGGASYPITDRLSAEVQVRHLDSTVTFTGHDVDLSSNVASVGLRVRIN
jgi:opacity protein-like surface antigen